MTRHLVSLLALLALLIATPVLWADNIPQLSYQYQIDSANGTSYGNNVTYYAAAPFSFSQTSSGTGCTEADCGTASATITGAADFGTLHAYSASSVNFAPGAQYQYCRDGVASYCGYAYGEVTVGLQDFLTFTSANLPAGTQVQYVVTETLHDSISYTSTDPSIEVHNCNSDQFIELASDAGTIYDSPCNGVQDYYNGSVVGSARTVSQILNGTVGGTNQLTASLFVTGRADTYCYLNQDGVGCTYFGQDSNIFDASNTASISIQVLTPGVTFTSASGATYAPLVSPVPEPGSLVLLGSGLLGLAGVLRRKSRDSSSFRRSSSQVSAVRSFPKL